MYARRHWFDSPEVAQRIQERLPSPLAIRRVLSDLRFIDYPLGGFIAPHTDGTRVDKETLQSSTHTFLLYLSDAVEGEGETEFLEDLQSCKVVASVVPKAGWLLVFPHSIPHQGNCVGGSGKLLLRGDMY
eukprot:TRINITY_DN2380_c0_g1_i1.p1 TRINITY_DN2380_c0_g1~~TRINITY_DN2380_c0_g1_i1.p1  ORF type:complete len:130 (-),score=14.81 TRINITY_DN2380_c0_g1_i1:97-486(-)